MEENKVVECVHDESDLKVTIIEPPWEQRLYRLVFDSLNEVILMVSYIKTSVMKGVLQRLRKGTRLKVLTMGTTADMARNSSDLEALIMAKKMGAEIRAITNDHTKIYIFDDDKIVVTSSNMGNQAVKGGRIECGPLFESKKVTKSFKRFFFKYWWEAKEVTFDDLEEMKEEIKKYREGMDEYKKDVENAGIVIPQFKFKKRGSTVVPKGIDAGEVPVIREVPELDDMIRVTHPPVHRKTEGELNNEIPPEEHSLVTLPKKTKKKSLPRTKISLKKDGLTKVERDMIDAINDGKGDFREVALLSEEEYEQRTEDLIKKIVSTIDNFHDLTEKMQARMIRFKMFVEYIRHNDLLLRGKEIVTREEDAELSEIISAFFLDIRDIILHFLEEKKIVPVDFLIQWISLLEMYDPVVYLILKKMNEAGIIGFVIDPDNSFLTKVKINKKKRRPRRAFNYRLVFPYLDEMEILESVAEFNNIEITDGLEGFDDYECPKMVEIDENPERITYIYILAKEITMMFKGGMLDELMERIGVSEEEIRIILFSLYTKGYITVDFDTSKPRFRIRVKGSSVKPSVDPFFRKLISDEKAVAIIKKYLITPIKLRKILGKWEFCKCNGKNGRKIFYKVGNCLACAECLKWFSVPSYRMFLLSSIEIA